jgi:hypothetical protein
MRIDIFFVMQYQACVYGKWILRRGCRGLPSQRTAKLC